MYTSSSSLAMLGMQIALAITAVPIYFSLLFLYLNLFNSSMLNHNLVSALGTTPQFKN
ncbi:MAG: hypothetical protein ACJASB_001550 [Shewanella psychromarinicola]|jgi:hypothetical protein